MKTSIHTARKAAGLTQEGLAMKLGITQGAVWQWENGRTTPCTGKLREIAAILCCSVDELLEKTPTKNCKQREGVQ